MKNSEIARYWAAKELTKIERDGSAVVLKRRCLPGVYCAACRQRATSHRSCTRQTKRNGRR